MKITSTIFTILLIGFNVYAQKLNFHIKDMGDTTVHLVKYVGSKLYYADTSEIKNGKVSFDGSKQDAGILAVLLPDQTYFEFIYNNEDVTIETKGPDYIENMIVKVSDENKIFLDYIQYMRSQRVKGNALQEEISHLDENQAAERKALQSQIESIGKEVVAYQNNLVEKNPNTLVAKIVKMSTDIQIPETPEGKSEREFRYEYFRDHFFDNIDLRDDRLVNTPVLQNKLEYFYSQNMLLQVPDTIIKYVFRVIDQIPEESLMYRFFVSNVTSHFEKSKIMGMDKVPTHMLHRYYCAKNERGEYKGYWMDDERLDEICETTEKRIHLMVGETPPNIILPDSTNNKWYNLHDLDAEYTILYFWDPGCGHCKKVTPQLGELYDKKFKERNIEIFSVGKATGDDFEAWKKFIRENNLNFINVGVTRQLYEKAKANPLQTLQENKTTLESINYQDTYDIYSTPRVFILDKDKKIIAKSLTIAQIELMLDELQEGYKDAEKLFNIEDDQEEIH